MLTALSSSIESWQPRRQPVWLSPRHRFPQNPDAAKQLMVFTDRSAVTQSMERCLLRVADSADRAAFEVLFRHFAPRIKAYLMRLGGDRLAVEELMQETMIRVWRKAAQFDPARSTAATWIYTIARNCRVDAYRRDRRPEFDPNDPALVPEPEPMADAGLLQQQDSDELLNAMDLLSDQEKTVLQLAFYEDKSQAVIASQLGIPLGTVKSRTRLAFAKLRSRLFPESGMPR